MKEPKNYELKKWLCQNSICGLKIHYFQTGSETAETEWEMESSSGEKKRVSAGTVSGIVDVRVDWTRVLCIMDKAKKEVDDWDDYAHKNADDLAEYERLKKKLFG